MSLRRLIPLFALVVSALLPARSEAVSVTAGISADGWLKSRQGLFGAFVAVSTPVAGPLGVGLRAGAAATAPGTELAVPLDVRLGVALTPNVGLYVCAGPWLLPQRDDLLALHASGGLSLSKGPVILSIEGGWLSPSPTAGLRLGWRF